MKSHMNEHDGNGDRQRAAGDQVRAPGWAAIDLAVMARYPGQTPHQFSSKRAYELESESPLPAISVWRAEAAKSWHYVTYGLSELFEKVSPIPDLSGYGIELTMRVADAPTDPHADTQRGDAPGHATRSSASVSPAPEPMPPTWPLRLLQTLGHYVLSRRKGFDSGHCIDLGGPIDQNTSQLHGLILVPDLALGQIATPHGRVLFLQAIGVTSDELEILRELKLDAQLGAMRDLDRWGVTDAFRSSWLGDEQAQKIFRRWQLGISLGS